METRTFISAYRYDPVRLLFVNKIQPVAVWVMAAGAILVPVMIVSTLWEAVEPSQQGQVLQLGAALALPLLTAPVAIYWMGRVSRRQMFETEWRLDDSGIARTVGSKTTHRRWDQVRGVQKWGQLLGRIRADGGSLWIDASMIEDVSPPPRLCWRFERSLVLMRMRIEYPDGRNRPLEIGASELYQAIAERLEARS